jgi:hypothetical protein
MGKVAEQESSGRAESEIEDMNYWLVKQEPESYSFATFQKEGKTDWTGVRNFTARNNLKEMKAGTRSSITTPVARRRWSVWRR